ncbi:MAG: MFS transporter [Roseovarius sp.]|nr:MFS transporter [Roseovarius sp.]
MLSILKNRDFARLFAAQVVALLGTGLLTVGLGLLAYDLAGAQAGLVLGIAFTVKMVAYVCLSPVAQALVQRSPRKAVLIGADLLRAGVALCLPFVTDLWQVYTLIFVLQAASATFTPAFQAVIPDILTDEGDYTRALSLSRLAYDLENLLSPALAGVLLLVLSYHWLFLGTVAGFLVSGWLVWRATVPPVAGGAARPFRERLTRGARIYLATPRLRGLLALNLAASSVGAFVLVNTVVLVRVDYGGGESALAVAMAAFGAGSMAAALMLPRALEWTGDRPVMLTGAGALVVLALGLGGALWAGRGPGWEAFLGLWALIGLGYAAILTPSGRLLRRSADAADRPALFAAQFALSHACWLVSYPMAGVAGRWLGMGPALMLAGLVAGLGLWGALRLWPGAGHLVPHGGQP